MAIASHNEALKYGTIRRDRCHKSHDRSPEGEKDYIVPRILMQLLEYWRHQYQTRDMDNNRDLKSERERKPPIPEDKVCFFVCGFSGVWVSSLPWGLADRLYVPRRLAHSCQGERGRLQGWAAACFIDSTLLLSFICFGYVSERCD